MFTRLNRYTPEMYLLDRQGPVTDRQRAYAAKMARMKGGILKEDGNRLSFTIYNTRKVCGTYAYTEYVFWPSCWKTIHYSDGLQYKQTLYAYV